jgi:hypothetical protein
MLDSWLNITNSSNEVIRNNNNTTTTNTPTYNQPQIRQNGVDNNNNGDYNWLFGIRK